MLIEKAGNQEVFRLIFIFPSSGNYELKKLENEENVSNEYMPCFFSVKDTVVV